MIRLFVVLYLIPPILMLMALPKDNPVSQAVAEGRLKLSHAWGATLFWIIAWPLFIWKGLPK